MAAATDGVGGDTLSLIEDWERSKLVPKGCYVKTKCDSCGRAIMSCLTFTGPNGEDFCSKACLNSGSEPEPNKSKEKESKKMKEVQKTKKGAKPAPESNKSAKPSKNKAAYSGKRKHEERTSSKKLAKPEPKPAKKVRAVEAEEVERNPNNPYARPGAIVYQIFELALAGTTVKEINKRIAEAGVKPTRVWRELRSGEFKGTKWKYTETEDGKITVRIRRAKSDE